MKNQKLDKLFEAARKENCSTPSPNFAEDVLRAIRREPPIAALKTISLFDQLNLLFPRLAIVSAAIILLCVAADYGVTAAGTPSLTDGTVQLSEQQLLPSNENSL